MPWPYSAEAVNEGKGSSQWRHRQLEQLMEYHWPEIGLDTNFKHSEGPSTFPSIVDAKAQAERKLEITDGTLSPEGSMSPVWLVF